MNKQPSRIGLYLILIALLVGGYFYLNSQVSGQNDYTIEALEQAFIQKKVSKLEKYYEDIKKVEVSLKVVKPEVAENKEAGIKILIPNGEFYASKVCDTFEEAIDLDVEALVKQLVKYKEKQRSK